MLDFAVNVLVPRPPAWLHDALSRQLTQLAAYPDPTAARAAAARHHGIGPEQVLPTNGAAEAFSLIHLAGLRAVLPGRRAHLVRVLSSHGLVVTEPAAGPFVLARHPRAAAVREALRHLGVAVRRGDTFPGLDDRFLRFAVRDEETVDALGTALSTIRTRLDADLAGL